MMDHEHFKDPEPEEGGPCWCGGSGKLYIRPNGGICNCGAPNAMPPCWNCENSTLVCDDCSLEIDEIDWPSLALGLMYGH